LANVGESGESEQNRLANVGESGEYSPSLMGNVGASAHDKIGRFSTNNIFYMHKMIYPTLAKFARLAKFA
jgi:hypothetical protein